MILNAQHHPVGTWWLSSPTSPTPEIYLDQWQAFIIETIEIFEAAKLLFPAHLTACDFVDCFTPACIQRMDPTQQAVPLAQDGRATIRELLRGEKKGMACPIPLHVDVFGKGIVILETGEEAALENLVSLHFYGAGYFSVEVATHSYIWLPFDLEGNPQNQLYQNNYRRLRDALAQCKDKFQLRLDPELHQPRYAIQQGLELRNITEPSGEPSDVMP